MDHPTEKKTGANIPTQRTTSGSVNANQKIPRWIIGWMLAIIFVLSLCLVALSVTVWQNGKTIEKLVSCQNNPAACTEDK